MRIFEVYWIRAILYLALAATLISVAVHVDQNNAATWYFGLILAIIAIMYLLASCKGEKSSLDETNANKDANANKDTKALESGVNREAAKSEMQAPASSHEIAMEIASDEGAQKAAVNFASKNPDLLRDALRAAAGSRL